MNRCTYLDEILQERVSSQSPDTQRISRSYVKGQRHMDFRVLFRVSDAAAIPADST